jgi:hypothetical protein
VVMRRTSCGASIKFLQRGHLMRRLVGTPRVGDGGVVSPVLPLRDN